MIFNLTIGRATTGCYSKFIAIILSALFAAHFALTTVIIYQLLVNGFILLFGINISLFILVFAASWCLASVFFLSSGDADIPNPTAPFALIVFFITAGKYDIISNPVSEYCLSLNTSSRCQFINYFIVVLLLPIFIVFGPLYSISFLIVNKERDWDEGFTVAVYYQLSFIIPSTIMQIIILCLTIKSLQMQMITTILCMIAVGVGITYLILIIFLGFDLLDQNNAQYLYALPFMINIELLLTLSMIIIASFMNLWGADFEELQYIVLLLCFINIFTANLPFLKSYLMEYYCEILREKALQYVTEDSNSETRTDKMFCYLLCVQTIPPVIKQLQCEGEILETKPKAMSMQQSVIQQYKFSLMTKKEKIQLINQNIKASTSNMWTVMWLIYALLSLVAFLSPIGWMLWITAHRRLPNFERFVFAWCLTSCYVLTIIGLIIYMIVHNIKLSYDGITYAFMYKKIKKAQTSNIGVHHVRTRYVRHPTIKVVFDRFQYDIGFIIILYLFMDF